MFLLCLFVQAKELQVKDPILSYQFSYDNDHMNFQGEYKKISFQKNSCNQKIIESVTQKLDFIIKRGPLLIPQKITKNMISFTLDKQTNYTFRNSPLGKILLKLPEEMERIKMEEELLKCSSQQGKGK